MNIESKLEKIENLYNSENDIIPGGPRVTWADMELVIVCQQLVEQITKLENRIELLEKRIYND